MVKLCYQRTVLRKKKTNQRNKNPSDSPLRVGGPTTKLVKKQNEGLTVVYCQTETPAWLAV